MKLSPGIALVALIAVAACGAEQEAEQPLTQEERIRQRQNIERLGTEGQRKVQGEGVGEREEERGRGGSGDEEPGDGEE